MQLAGRDDLLDELVAALDGGQSWLLYGPAGIGKSSVLKVAAERLAPGTRILAARPAEVDSELPYLALIDLFADVLPHAQAIPAHLREALEVALLRAQRMDGVSDKLAIRLAVLELLRELANHGPVVLILDDLQWIDTASAEVLAFVARRLNTVHVAILAAERTDDDDSMALRLSSEALTPVRVPPLSRLAITALIAGRGGGRLPAALVERVWRASGGNPLYAEELSRALLRDSSIAAPHVPLPVPGKLRPLLLQRLQGLDEETRACLLHAAMMSRPTLEQLRRCGVLPADGLDAAERTRLIEVSADGAVRFTHPLFRELIYSDATASQRRAGHAQVAIVMEGVVEKVRHLALGAAGPDEATAALADAAAEEAARRGAPATAAALARLAAQHTPPDGADSIAARLLACAQHAFAAGQMTAAREAASACLDKAGIRSVRVAARLLLIELAGWDATAKAHLAAAEQESTDDIGSQAQVALCAAEIAYYDRRHSDADRLAKLAETLARQTSDVDLVIRALNLQAIVTSALGRDGVPELHAMAREMARGRPITTATMRARQWWAMSSLFRGDFTAAMDEISHLETEVRAQGAVAQLMYVLQSATAIYRRTGHGADALRAGRECRQLFLDTGLTPWIGQAVAAQAECYAGSAETAVQLAKDAVRMCTAGGDREWLEPCHIYHGEALLLSGQYQAAVTAFGHARELEAARTLGPQATWHADYGEALARTGRVDDAAEFLKQAYDSARRANRTLALLGLARADAIRACFAGESLTAIEALAAAIDTYGAQSYPLDAARASLTLGQLLRRVRRRSAAHEAISQAIDQFSQIGAAPWRALADAELDRLHNGVRHGRNTKSLSGLERQIVELVRAGATNRQIAKEVHLSVKAVEANLSRLYRRLGVANRSEMLRLLDS
ncbi:AAA family ATPase [Micromonospora yasonensis]|uniref:AAA family ATPase n=1 Tax=Micromonospora yasonensis TaxID=1128667 RepID=UPI0022323A9D|nr:AAA family ATPase [Micromonospora yasonensis]MCW3841552.1 AAA family ATPase [Micromonospora yasonensis]